MALPWRHSVRPDRSVNRDAAYCGVSIEPPSLYRMQARVLRGKAGQPLSDEAGAGEMMIERSNVGERLELLDPCMAEQAGEEA